MCSQEDNNVISVSKWRDVHDIIILFTKHAPILTTNTEIHNNDHSLSLRDEKLKPAAIWDYNKEKVGVDQMVSYATTLRKGVKWYRKLGIEMILGIAIVNSLIIYKKTANKNIGLRNFREKIICSLLEIEGKREFSVQIYAVFIIIFQQGGIILGKALEDPVHFVINYRVSLLKEKLLGKMLKNHKNLSRLC
ncbi:hypothetical protein NGRA_1069 [Nosema granulosis]|uniref:PiggyBac transposable element-derived protein domain-containing protein n=1 Tax=Nosema granulosis TaxID=83296 RepID=A0A9P6H060_9MICR|nr:hypothetical protein NGRA_1069 [Nosema granulosis]